MSGEGALLSNAGAVFPVAATDTGAGQVAPARSGDLVALAGRYERAALIAANHYFYEPLSVPAKREARQEAADCFAIAAALRARAAMTSDRS